MPAQGYRSTLKPLEVEELIDLLVHRPLAHLLVLAVKGTAITPDQLTIVSMLVGVAAGVATLSSFVTGRPYLWLGGLLLILSAVVDCSDGQLARLRKTSSTFGRMLDGAVDAVVQIAVIPAALLHVWWRNGGDTPGAPALGHSPFAAWLSPTGWLVLGVAAILTGIAHTTLYDYFKNVYLRMTMDGKREGDEDPEEVVAQYAAAQARGVTLLDRIRYEMYIGHVTNQRALLRAVDPNIPARFRDMPTFSPDGRGAVPGRAAGPDAGVVFLRHRHAHLRHRGVHDGRRGGGVHPRALLPRQRGIARARPAAAPGLAALLRGSA
jgi:phosphatidylglycerophosphate synthase